MLTIRYPESKRNENTYARYRAKWIAQPWKYQNTIKLNTLTLISDYTLFRSFFAFSHFFFLAFASSQWKYLMSSGYKL